jgi:hypothetical protein
MADIAKIKDRLAALLKKARDNGSTPNEVEQAMAAAAKIMERYGVTEDDLRNASEEDFRHVRFNRDPGKDKHCPVLRYVGPAIARFVGVKIWVCGGIDGEMNVLGMESDVELFMWMWKSLRQFMDDQWATYKRVEVRDMGVTREELTALRVTFIREFCAAVANRLAKLGAQTGGAQTGTSLIVLKNQVVEKRLADMGISLGRGVKVNGNGRGDYRAAAAGAAAGRAADIGRGVGQARAAIGYRT